MHFLWSTVLRLGYLERYHAIGPTDRILFQKVLMGVHLILRSLNEISSVMCVIELYECRICLEFDMSVSA